MKITHKVFYRITHGEDANINDMLRYDLAFACDAAPGLIMFPQFRTRAGRLGGKVTAARWRSFGVIMARQHYDLPEIIPSEWYTFRHPKKENGPFDYSDLEKVTLQRFCEVSALEHV